MRLTAEKRAAVLESAKEDFKRCEEWENAFRARYDDDMRFADADPDNGYQWDATMYRQRQLKRKPSLTINKTRQFCLQIINDARQNKSQIRIVPSSDDASYEAAEIFEGIVRHIEYTSDAQSAYIGAYDTLVKGGIGYWRVATDYRNNRTTEQDIFIRRIKDPRSVYMDPDIQTDDGSDARFAFIFDDMPRKLFERKYPKFAESVQTAALGNNGDWESKDHVRIAEYYRKTEKRDRLIVNGMGQTFLKSQIGAEMAAMLEEDDTTHARDIIEDVIECYLIIGNEIAEMTVWAGKYIPIVRLAAEESVIDGQMDRKGHVRSLKDPQRMFNYWASAATEQIALQTKTPWLAPARAIETYQEIWKNAAITEPTVLPWDDVDDSGNPIAKPERIAPPTIAQAYMAGLEISEHQMAMVSGQVPATMGEPSNERSGKAINARQRQGENATYHFIDILASALRFTGKILIDLIPKIYDTPRVVQIVAEDGKRSAANIDPEAAQAHQTVQSEDQDEEDEAQIIFNPNVGEYSVEADVGPAYQTKRQEAFQAFINIASASPEIMQKAGDLMFKAADFPMADDIAERLKPGPAPELVAAQQQMQQMGGTIQKLMQELLDMRDERKHSEAKHEIETYRAETDRMAVVKDIDPEALKPIIRQMIVEAMGTSLPDLQARHGIVPQPEQPEPME